MEQADVAERGPAGERPADARRTPAVSELALEHSVESHAFLQSVLNASADCIKVLTFDGDLLFMNDGGRSVMEVDDFETVRGCPWLGFWEGDGKAAAQAALDAARAGGIGRFHGAASTAKGTPKYWEVTVSHIASPGSVRGHILSISRDITHQREIAAQRELLSRELSHRVKNSLAIAQAIGRQTFRGVADDRLEDFGGRLAALGKAQDLLLQTAWQTVRVGDVVEATLGPLCPNGRCAFEGEDYELSAQRGLSLALALHELGTNAVKYGALASQQGKVRVAWSVVCGEFRISWAESGGPPVVAPTHTGFGTRIVTRNLAADFGGKVDLNYPPTGMVWTLAAPA